MRILANVTLAFVLILGVRIADQGCNANPPSDPANGNPRCPIPYPNPAPQPAIPHLNF